MQVRVRYAALLLMIPGMCVAQRGRGGFIRRGPARESAIEVPKLVNPVNLLIEHRTELSLSDSQFMQVIRMKRVLDSTNAPLMRRLDSVQHTFKGGLVLSEPTREHRDSLAEARLLVQQTTADLRDNYSTAKDKAFAVLDARQYDKATELLGTAERAIADEEEKARKEPGRGPPG